MRLGRLAGVVVLCLSAAAVAADEQRRSGYEFMSPETRAMQDDDGANPGMLSVLDGEALWSRSEGADGKSCASCHGDARSSMKGVAARYPAFDPAAGRPIDLEQRINRCRTDHQHITALPFESNDLLALTVYVAHQSKDQPITVSDDRLTRPFIASGRALYQRRQGQLNLSCANCHDDNSGGRLGGSPIPQALPTGYPIYRLEWQSLGSLRRRLRNCMIGMRAEPYANDSEDIVDLELFLAWRARGMPLETPAVRP